MPTRNPKSRTRFSGSIALRSQAFMPHPIFSGPSICIRRNSPSDVLRAVTLPEAQQFACRTQVRTSIFYPILRSGQAETLVAPASASNPLNVAHVSNIFRHLSRRNQPSRRANRPTARAAMSALPRDAPATSSTVDLRPAISAAPSRGVRHHAQLRGTHGHLRVCALRRHRECSVASRAPDRGR